MSYNDLRHFADSWGLVFMGVTYLILIGWHFLPRGRQRSAEAALAIFEREDADNG
ncbi:cbb3-type cytochrome oxidase subunit 3 [Sphingobium sp.]|uniref:cbb3-type cytochrome oxidase subunit 3 n=1 Tax=Sphingobium sp. TaxID=1912891 RepID=UPI0035C76BAD